MNRFTYILAGTLLLLLSGCDGDSASSGPSCAAGGVCVEGFSCIANELGTFECQPDSTDAGDLAAPTAPTPPMSPGNMMATSADPTPMSGAPSAEGQNAGGQGMSSNSGRSEDMDPTNAGQSPEDDSGDIPGTQMPDAMGLCTPNATFYGQILGVDADVPNGGSFSTTPPNNVTGIAQVLERVPPAGVDGRNPPPVALDNPLFIDNAIVVATEEAPMNKTSFWIAGQDGAIEVFLDPDDTSGSPAFEVRVGLVVDLEVTEVTRYFGKPEITGGANWGVEESGSEVYLEDEPDRPLVESDVNHMVRITGQVSGQPEGCGGKFCWAFSYGSGLETTLRTSSRSLPLNTCLTYVGPVGIFKDKVQLDVINNKWLSVLAEAIGADAGPLPDELQPDVPDFAMPATDVPVGGDAQGEGQDTPSGGAEEAPSDAQDESDGGFGGIESSGGIDESAVGGSDLAPEGGAESPGSSRPNDANEVTVISANGRVDELGSLEVGEEDIFRFSLDAATRVIVTTDDAGGPCSENMDTVVDLYSNGDLIATHDDRGFDENFEFDYCSELSEILDAGEYEVRVRVYDEAQSIPVYGVRFEFWAVGELNCGNGLIEDGEECDDPSDAGCNACQVVTSALDFIEPNTGRFQAASFDRYFFIVPDGARARVSLTTEVAADGCSGENLDTVISVFRVVPNDEPEFVAYDDDGLGVDGSGNRCSFLEEVFEAGAYDVFVEDYRGAGGVDYILSATYEQLESVGDIDARPASPGEIIINEVDYDQQGNDGREFVELINTTDEPLSLEGIMLSKLNGANGRSYGAHRLSDAGLVLPGRGVLVIGSAAIVLELQGRSGLLKLVVSTGFLQNGTSDALSIMNADGVVLDALTYEGTSEYADYVEGSGLSPENSDLPGDVEMSIGRCPGPNEDTGDNANDFSQMIPTPGIQNICN